ncbi:MAG: hypothetical protein IT426_06440 [Pirellulales bacterium]|nr:hypothetical protein [Pirellulales bacterium]
MLNLAGQLIASGMGEKNRVFSQPAASVGMAPTFDDKNLFRLNISLAFFLMRVYRHAQDYDNGGFYFYSACRQDPIGKFLGEK